MILYQMFILLKTCPKNPLVSLFNASMNVFYLNFIYAALYSESNYSIVKERTV